jgi:hypothetical protein
MQAALDAEFGRDSDDGGASEGCGSDGVSRDMSHVDDLFCPACNKQFKSSKA